MGIGSTGEEIDDNALNSHRIGSKELQSMHGALAWELLEMCEQMFKEGKVGKFIVKRVKLGGD